MGKALVCQKAECECEHGNMPDKIISVSKHRQYVNDVEGEEKMIVSTMDIGQPFEKKTFGTCKLQPTPSGYKVCQAQITKWEDFYDKVTLDNGGNPILENSKAICPIAGVACISITFHGQKGEMTEQHQEEADPEVQNMLNPLASSTDTQEVEVKHTLNATE